MPKEIKLNNWTEILNKVKEMVAEDNSWKIEEEYWASPAVTLGWETKKSRQGARLVRNGESVDIFLETINFIELNRERNLGKEMNEYLKNIAELDKIIGRCESKECPAQPENPTPPTPPSKPEKPEKPISPTPTDDKKDNQPVIWSSRFTGCHSLEIAKKHLQEYYQKNQNEIQKNPDFSRWVKVDKKENVSYVCIGNKPVKDEDLSKLPDWQKDLYSKMNIDKAELTLSMKYCLQQDTNQIEKELKDFWTSLTDKKDENKDDNNKNGGDNKGNDKKNKPVVSSSQPETAKIIVIISLVILAVVITIIGIILVCRPRKRKRKKY